MRNDKLFEFVKAGVSIIEGVREFDNQRGLLFGQMIRND